MIEECYLAKFNSKKKNNNEMKKMVKMVKTIHFFFGEWIWSDFIWYRIIKEGEKDKIKRFRMMMMVMREKERR